MRITLVILCSFRVEIGNPLKSRSISSMQLMFANSKTQIKIISCLFLKVLEKWGIKIIIFRILIKQIIVKFNSV